MSYQIVVPVSGGTEGFLNGVDVDAWAVSRFGSTAVPSENSPPPSGVADATAITGTNGAPGQAILELPDPVAYNIRVTYSGNTYWSQTSEAIIMGALPTSGGSMTGSIDLGGNKIIGLADGVGPNDAVAFEQLSSYAPLDSPIFSGNPEAPTPTYPDATQSIATTSYVNQAIGSWPVGYPRVYEEISTNGTLDCTAGIDCVYIILSPVTLINLPSAAVYRGNIATVKNYMSTPFSLAPNGSETIDGTTGAISITPYQSLDLFSDGNVWYIL